MILTLLIDDESAARADLRAKLAAHPEVIVVGEAATVNAARTLLAGAKYDLVFLDIQLIGGDGFQLVPHVRAGAQIIFATGFDRHALRAFEVNALDYVLKPISPERLAASLDRVRGHAKDDHFETFSPGSPLREDDVIYLRSSSRARFSAVADISFIVARENYSEVLFCDGTTILLRKSLKSLEDVLPSIFQRVNRTAIINLTYVQKYERDAEERILLNIQGVPEPITVSRQRWGELQDRLERIFPSF